MISRVFTKDCAVCREQRNLSDLCVDPLPCVWSVYDGDHFGSHWSCRLDRRSERERRLMIKEIMCAHLLPQIEHKCHLSAVTYCTMEEDTGLYEGE